MRLIAVGKLREPYVREAVADFSKRLSRVSPIEEVEVAASNGADPTRAMREEGERILRGIDPSDTVWLLERTGAEISSVELSAKITALADAAASRLTIVVAGTFGADPALVARADFEWSLSKLTFLHEWARAIVLEQLYRAAKIARNEPYHH
jgi:23S rRNA (pseudouridine1915-N3)-methyltransferase